MYAPIPNTVAKEHISYPSAHRSRTHRVQHRSYVNNIDSTLSSDSYPLLDNNSLSSFSAWRQHKNAAASDIELVNIDTSSDYGNTREQASIWSTYNPFSSRGRRLLNRKIRSSGPATMIDEDTKHINQSWLAKSTRVAGTGWRAGTRMCCFAVIFCITIELALLIWAAKTNGQRDFNGLIYEGSCDTVRRLEVWLLLPLNIAATILIGTSNYVMQVMSAPDREDIDQAHRFAKAISLIGVKFDESRFHGKTGRPRRIIWWLLFLSSLPIHLFLNVAFYGSVQAVNPGVVVVSEDFVNDSTWDQCTADFTQNSVPANFTCWMKQLFDSDQTRQLSASQCKSQYELGFQKNASSVIVVTDKGTNSWYNGPVTANIPGSYGLACQYANYSSSVLVALPNSERVYNFNYVEQTGNFIIDLDFLFCQNTTGSNADGTPSWSLSTTTNTLIANPLTEGGALLRTENDSLSNISNVRSVFSGREFRYWATAQTTGDYLSQTSQALLNQWDPTKWVCQASYFTTDDQCNAGSASEWKITPEEYSVKECYAMPKEEQCALRYSLQIIILTMCCDLIKLAAMILALRSVSNPLTTIGDIVQSFLQNPDPYTKHTYLLIDEEASRWSWYSRDRINEVKRKPDMLSRTHKDLKEHPNDFHSHNFSNRDLTTFKPIKYELQPQKCLEWMQNGGAWWTTVEPPSARNSWSPQSHLWRVVPSRARWGWFAVLYACAIGFLVVYFAIGLTSLLKQRLGNMWTVGFSGPDPSAILVGGLLDNTRSISWAAIVVNLPQLLFSSMYFVFNAMLTIMHTAHEWGSFSTQRKALRVSSPQGRQRSTYWLQLPWSYSLPLIVGSGTLHWLLGRSVYLVKVDVFSYDDSRDADKDFFACGYSLITVLMLIVVLIVMGAALGAVSCKKLAAGIPLVRVNSLAIAAACHPDLAEEDLPLKPLMWGVIKTDPFTGVPHCSFSAKEVTPLREGDTYM